MSFCRYIKMESLVLTGMVFLFCSCGSSRLLHKDKEALSADELFMRGEQMKLNQRPQEAIQYFQAFSKKKPENATAYFEIARQYNHLQQPDSVLVYAEKAAQLAPSNKWIYQFYGRTLANVKHYTAAASIFRRLAARYPHTDDFVFQEALMLFYAKKYRESLHLFDSLEQTEGVSEKLVFQKQRIYLKLHLADSAASEIQKLITQSPDNGRYYALLAKMYAKNDRPQQAVNVYKGLLNRQPGNPRAQLALGILYKQMHRPSEFKKYIKTVFHNPDFGIEQKIRFIYPFLQYVKVDTTEKADALWLCRLLTRIHGQDARAYALLGDMLFKCDKTDSALFQYKKALHYKHAHYEIWNQIMLIYAKEGNVDSLMNYSMEAVQHFPNNARARYFNGIAHFFKGQNKNAASELQQALQIGIRDNGLRGAIYKSLADIYRRLNNRREAAKYRSKAERLQKSEKVKNRKN